MHVHMLMFIPFFYARLLFNYINMIKIGFDDCDGFWPEQTV